MNITVYCSAKDQIDERYKLLGRELGRWLATSGHTLVFGGATGGLMTAVSEAAFEAGGQVIGVVTHRIIAAGRRSPYCTETIEVEQMSQRKQQMKDLADCFVCLPGSYGTLDEMFDVIASGTVNEHRKPIYILNDHGYYSALQQQATLMKELQFLPEQEHYKPHYVDTLEEIFVELDKFAARLKNH